MVQATMLSVLVAQTDGLPQTQALDETPENQPHVWALFNILNSSPSCFFLSGAPERTDDGAGVVVGWRVIEVNEGWQPDGTRCVVVKNRQENGTGTVFW